MARISFKAFSYTKDLLPSSNESFFSQDNKLNNNKIIIKKDKKMRTIDRLGAGKPVSYGYYS